MLFVIFTQMGSQFKGKIVEDQMADILRQWHAEVRNRRKKEQQLSQSGRSSFSIEWSAMRNSIRRAFRPAEPAESSVHSSHRWDTRDEIVEQEGSSSRGFRRNSDAGS